MIDEVQIDICRFVPKIELQVGPCLIRTVVLTTLGVKNETRHCYNKLLQIPLNPI